MPKPEMRIMITGGAGGIAEAVLEQLTARFCGAVGLVDIDHEGMDRLRSTYGSNDLTITPYHTDLLDDGALRTAVIAFAAQFGGMDLLFANAGIMTGPGPFEVEDAAAVARSIDLNFKAVAMSTQAAWSHLSAAKGQVIVNASGAGLTPLPSDVIYSASKAAVIMFARANALRHTETGIRFNVICPGVVDTPILNDERTGEWRDEVHFFNKHFHLIQPSEIADAVIELIGNTETNGAVISVENKRKA